MKNDWQIRDRRDRQQEQFTPVQHVSKLARIIIILGIALILIGLFGAMLSFGRSV